MDGSESTRIVGFRSVDRPVQRWRALMPLGIAAVIAGGLGAGVELVTSEPDRGALRIEALSQRAERLRGLSLKQPVVVERVQRADLAERFAEALAGDDDPDLPAAEALLRLMGFLKAKESLSDLYAEGIEASVAGFYDPETAMLSLVERGDVGASGGTILHEIVHAIQDEQFDLDGATLSPDDDDAALAARALVEGDATEVELRFLEETGLAGVLGEIGGGLAQLQGFDGSSGPDIPFLNRLFSLPYNEGARFVTALRERGGRRLVDQAFRSPPKTTLAILEPERYGTDRDRAEPVAVPAAPPGHDRVMDTTFGAADVYALTDERELGVAWRGGRVTVDRTRRSGVLRIVVVGDRAGELARGLDEAIPAEARIIRTGRQVDVVIRGALPLDQGAGIAE